MDAETFLGAIVIATWAAVVLRWRWAHGMRVEKTFTPITRIGPALPITVIAAEDGRYCRHRGVVTGR